MRNLIINQDDIELKESYDSLLKEYIKFHVQHKNYIHNFIIK